MNVCQRNVVRSAHVEYMFDKINDKINDRVLETWCHCDFRKIDALKVHKFGRS